MKEFSSRPSAVPSVAGGAAALHLTDTAARARAKTATRLTRVAGAAAAVPQDAPREIVAMRTDASASQRWSARGLVMPLQRRRSRFAGERVQPVYSITSTELVSIGRRMRRARGSRPAPSPPPPLQLKFQQRGAKQSFSTKTCGTRFHALLRPAPFPSQSLARVCAACRLNPSEAARARRAIA